MRCKKCSNEADLEDEELCSHCLLEELWEQDTTDPTMPMGPNGNVCVDKDDKFNSYGYDPTGPEAGAGFRDRSDSE